MHPLFLIIIDKYEKKHDKLIDFQVKYLDMSVSNDRISSKVNYYI